MTSALTYCPLGTRSDAVDHSLPIKQQQHDVESDTGKQGHAHGSAVMMVTAGEDKGWKYALTAYLLEIGCVFHSVIIGMSLGMTADRKFLVALFIALCFHQVSDS